jgi:hypothetical protein
MLLSDHDWLPPYPFWHQASQLLQNTSWKFILYIYIYNKLFKIYIRETSSYRTFGTIIKPYFQTVQVGRQKNILILGCMHIIHAHEWLNYWFFVARLIRKYIIIFVTQKNNNNIYNNNLNMYTLSIILYEII